MTREEAIKELRGFIGQLTEGCQEAIKVLIPELSECEDERIRKALIDGVRQIRCKNGITQEQMLNWLEKQKEQKDFQAKVEQRMEYLWDKLPDTHKVEEGNCTPEEWKTLGAYMELEMNFDKDSEEQKEQKPAEWSEEDENNIGKLHRLLVICQSEKKFIPTSEYEKLDKWLKSLRPQSKEEQKPVDLEKAVEFECIGKKVKMTIQELIDYYIDSECADVADECGF